MARPTKSVTTRTGHMSKADIDKRLEYKSRLRGDSDKIRAPAYMKDFFRMCDKLSLSPQARTKIANINCSAEAEKGDPLLMILGGGKK